MTKILILGVILAILFYELTDISPGGIIVPGLLVVYILDPLRIIYTVIIAIISYFLVKLASKRFLIYGKRRFALLIIVSFVLHFLINLVLGLFIETSQTFIVSLVGYTCAGIIASNYFKQGVIKTTLSLGSVVVVLELIVILFRTLNIL